MDATTEYRNPEPVPKASKPVTITSRITNFLGNFVNSFRPKTSPPLAPNTNTQPQKGGNPSKKPRNSRKRGGYVIKKPNSKSRSRRKSK